MPVINEITEDDVNDLSDQIRQLKEELLKTKSDVYCSVGTKSGCFEGRNACDSLNQLRRMGFSGSSQVQDSSNLCIVPVNEAGPPEGLTVQVPKDAENLLEEAKKREGSCQFLCRTNS